jgi:hypothetical protein
MSQVKQRFQVGDYVHADHGPSFTSGGYGFVVGHKDWWTLVDMEQTGIVVPYMEGEIKHVYK